MTTIFYFSGTGNSLIIARELQLKLEGETEMIGIAAALKQSQPLTRSQAIGLVFPVYMFGLPLIIKRFIRNLSIDGAPYIFALATNGGLPAATLSMLQKELRKKGQTLNAGWAIRMPGNYTPFYGADSDEKIRNTIQTSLGRLPSIAAIINQKQNSKIETNNIFTNILFSGLFYTISSGKIPTMDKKFLVETQCTHCGRCAQICPVDNIVIKEGLPHWLGHCEQCLACLQTCPVEAIQFGKSTKGRKRYFAPAVKNEELRKQKEL